MTQTKPKPTDEEPENEFLARYRVSSRTEKAAATMRLALMDVVTDAKKKGQTEVTDDEIIDHLFAMIDDEVKDRGGDTMIDMWVHMCCSFYLIANSINGKAKVETLDRRLRTMMGEKPSKIILLN